MLTFSKRIFCHGTVSSSVVRISDLYWMIWMFYCRDEEFWSTNNSRQIWRRWILLSTNQCCFTGHGYQRKGRKSRGWRRRIRNCCHKKEVRSSRVPNTGRNSSLRGGHRSSGKFSLLAMSFPSFISWVPESLWLPFQWLFWLTINFKAEILQVRRLRSSLHHFWALCETLGQDLADRLRQLAVGIAGRCRHHWQTSSVFPQSECVWYRLVLQMYDNGYRMVHSIDTNANVIKDQSVRNRRRADLSFACSSATQVGFRVYVVFCFDSKSLFLLCLDRLGREERRSGCW